MNLPPGVRITDPKCEHTEPGAETEAIDCHEGPGGRRARATRRHVDDFGRTLGLFCDVHSRPDLRRVAEVEYVPSRTSGLILPTRI